MPPISITPSPPGIKELIFINPIKAEKEKTPKKDMSIITIFDIKNQIKAMFSHINIVMKKVEVINFVFLKTFL